MKVNRLIKIAVVIIGVGLIISLSRNIYRLLKTGDQVKLVQQRLEKLEKEHQELLEKKEYYQSEEFVEQEARNRLNLGKPGETIVILPPNVGESGEVSSVTASELPIWKQWLKLFF